MKPITHLIALTCLALTLTACGDATTDEKLPAGTAPNQGLVQDERSESNDPKQEPQTADDKPKLPGPADIGNDRRTSEGLSYILPPGWRVGPSKTMRVLTLIPPAKYESAELAVAHWRTGVGDFQGNIQRWAVMQLQMDAGQVANARDGFATIEVGDAKGTWVPLINPATDRAILGLWVPRPHSPIDPKDTWTFKLSNVSSEQLDELAPTVRAWAESIRFIDK